MKIAFSVALSVLSGICVAADTPAISDLPSELLLEELEDDSVAEVVEDAPAVGTPAVPAPQPSLPAIKQPPPPADPMRAAVPAER